MKILIVGFAKIKYMPYLNLYLENLDREKNEIHLVYWNRDERSENLSSVEGLELHEFKCYQEDEVSKTSKIKNFLKFKKHVKSILKEKFDFIIVLQSVTAVLLSDILVSKRFKNKYIYDYRDCTYENVGAYKNAVSKLAENSYATFVSSKGFERFLPQSEKIKFSHNILSEDLLCCQDIKKIKTSSQKIRIGFWGFLREEDVNLKIIEKVSKDQRFELHYYGREQKTACNLKEYVHKNKIKNVFFHGEYEPRDKYEFLKNTDIIHNIYAHENMKSATSNKFYDGVVFKIPQICMSGTYMGECVNAAGVGVVLDPYSDNFINELYSYSQNVDKNVLSENCDNILAEIKKEQNEVISTIKTI